MHNIRQLMLIIFFMFPPGARFVIVKKNFRILHFDTSVRSWRAMDRCGLSPSLHLGDKNSCFTHSGDQSNIAYFCGIVYIFNSLWFGFVSNNYIVSFHFCSSRFTKSSHWNKASSFYEAKYKIEFILRLAFDSGTKRNLGEPMSTGGN